jgi:LmbE family N-acetylglucosaminyl deacetylase
VSPYHQFVSEHLRLQREGRTLPLGGFIASPRTALAPDAPSVLIFSPHPDDEVIIGGLALRLLRESGWRVVNVAVTQGSSKERQAERLEELRRCCAWIGFELVTTVPGGLERVQFKTREQDPRHWNHAVGLIAGILRQWRPRAILFPHDQDWNSTHVGTHWLVRDALENLGSESGCYTVETEFWGALANPNLSVAISEEHLGDLITALTFHAGEVRRNPYHLSLPAWMIDNVRRGAELVGGQGGSAPDCAFATLYRVRRWEAGRWLSVLDAGRHLPISDPAAVLFPRQGLGALLEPVSEP